MSGWVPDPGEAAGVESAKNSKAQARIVRAVGFAMVARWWFNVGIFSSRSVPRKRLVCCGTSLQPGFLLDAELHLAVINQTSPQFVKIPLEWLSTFDNLFNALIFGGHQFEKRSGKPFDAGAMDRDGMSSPTRGRRFGKKKWEI